MSVTDTITTIHRLHYISQQQAAFTHTDAIHKALDAGCRWIQLRVKNQPTAIVGAIAASARRLCNQYHAILVVNDYPHVARDAGADALHLGLTDMPLQEARHIVGASMLIGGTANTWQDVWQRTQEGADYIGLGPFRFTSTKQQLSPILGIEGYRHIMQQAAEAALTVPPVIAIGGIVAADIPLLLQAGIHGVAVSGAITAAPDPAAVVQTIYDTFSSHNLSPC